jgi:hypothetical protein
MDHACHRITDKAGIVWHGNDSPPIPQFFKFHPDRPGMGNGLDKLAGNTDEIGHGLPLGLIFPSSPAATRPFEDCQVARRAIGA